VTAVVPVQQERWMPRWLLPAAIVGVLAPLAVAVIAQRNAGWHPVFDLAMTELRVRDVGGQHTPLIGLQGRIGPTGSHPGPVSFYLLAPVYRLLGSSSFALQAATGVFHGAAVVTALLVVRRRREGWALLAVALVLLLLMQGYGLGALTEPWNPQLPLLWFFAFLVAAWAVIDGDLPMLLPAVLAASIGAQTHVPYLPVTLGIGGVVTGVAVRHAWLRHRDERAPDWRWLLAAAGLGVVLWVPPLIDEAINEPGNLSQIVDHLGSPAEEPIGLRAGADFVLLHLDAWQLVVGETEHPGTFVRVLSGPGPSKDRGLVTGGVWAACVAASAVSRHRRLLGLHALVGVSAVVATVAISRIYGVAWPYLMLWAYGIGALMLVSIGATIVVLLRRHRAELASSRVTAGLGLAALVVLVALSVRLLALAPDTHTETPDQTEQLGRLVPGTVAALEEGVGAAAGRDGRYLVQWSDATNGGSEGIGLVNELIRRGFDVGVEEREGVKIGRHRVRPEAEASARIVLASGGWIEQWASEPGAVRVAYDDPASDAERAEFAEVRADAIEALVEQGRADLVDRIDTDLFSVALNEGVGGDASLLFGRLLDIGVPVAVFVLPLEAP
jgi:hypothetical protein